MDSQVSQPPAGRPLWMRLIAVALRYVTLAVILGLWTAVALSSGQAQMALITVSVAISLLYLLLWAFRMLLSRKARLALKGEGRTFWEGVVPLLMLWLGWALSDVGSHLHDTFLGVSVLATIFFCIGAYAAYVTTPREGEKIRLEDLGAIDGCGEGCLEVILTGFLGR
ncbi:MAG TPA: hypothetical protein VH590_21670 [Ktedonobacterales bacterium]|jgi:hypothetical protein